MAWNFVFWDEISFCDRKCLPVTGHFFLWQDISSVTGNFFLWQEISSCDRKFLPLTGNFYQWQEISTTDRKFLTVTGYFFLSQDISSCGMKFITQNFLPGQNISGIFLPSDIKSQQKHVIFATKVCDFCSLPRLRAQGFLTRFLAPWPLKSHPDGPVWAIQDYTGVYRTVQEHKGLYRNIRDRMGTYGPYLTIQD